MQKYDKTSWVANETLVAADKLNKIENQLESLTNESITFNKQLEIIPTSSVYNSALNSLIFDTNKLKYFYRAILQGSCKIALWGDSITEGIDQNSYKDTYAYKLEQELKRLFPTVTFTIQNFAIGGTGIDKALSNTYIPNYPWNTGNKTWRNCVKDFAPNLIIFAFGMNDIGTAYWTSEYSYNKLNEVKTMLDVDFETDLILVNTMLPTSKSTSNYSIHSANGVAKAYREWAKVNGYNLIDANRLSNILLHGKDVETCNSVKIKNTQVITEEFLNVEISGKVKIKEVGQHKASVILYRNIKDTAHFDVIIFAENSTNFKVQLYVNTGNGGEVLSTYNFNSSLNTDIAFKIDVVDRVHKVYVNGTLAINLTTPKILMFGGVNIGSWGQVVYSNLIVNGFRPVQTNFTMTETQILGGTSNELGGNLFNHPSSLGNELIYNNAFKCMYDNITNFSKFQTSIKIDPTQWSVADGSYIPPTGKKLWYKIITLNYDKTNNMILESDTSYKILSAVSSNADLQKLKDNEFAFYNFGSTKIVFITTDSTISTIDKVYYLKYYVI